MYDEFRFFNVFFIRISMSNRFKIFQKNISSFCVIISMDKISELNGGRIIDTRLLTQVQSSQILENGGRCVPAFVDDICHRCWTRVQTDIFKGKKVYCRGCLNFGKIYLDDQLIITNNEVTFGQQSFPLTWRGQLTEMQRTISEKLIESFYKSEDHLVWAVTGAGKTEMIFPLIAEAIKNDKRIAICSPRIDVCIELFPRIKAAFENTSIALFHGRSDEEYHCTQIMIATVHQLIRFEQAFDVLIIDEVDSFPLAGDIMLERAIEKSKKPNGINVYLSATPPLHLLNRVDAKNLNLSKMYQRFHQHPLPEPKTHLLFKPSNFTKINPRLKFRIEKLVKLHEKFMLFFPRIPEMLEFESNLRKSFPDLKMVSVSSKDADRINKVGMFRNDEVQAILTTTILERGVTFHQITVIVIDADAKEFSKTALIQIAGRAGRSKDSPDDEVHFYYNYYSRQIKLACDEIKSVNKQARKK
ncbi:DEAD/DEAH box helicase [Lactobacillus salsicarnum]|nr:DEAD/DEAH box helicase [Companilactobacillus mishanensis]